MISECLYDINDKTDLHLFYNQESPNKLPPLLICKDKLEKQNDDVEKYILNKNNSVYEGGNMGSYTKYNFDMCNDSINHQLYINDRDNRISEDILNNKGNDLNYLNKRHDDYKKYASIIDVESDLKQVDLIRDKCFNDNHTLDRNTSPLNKHKNIYKKETTLLNDIKDKSKNMRYINKQGTDVNCIESQDRTLFKQCNNDEINGNQLECFNDTNAFKTENEQVYYKFNNQEYCRDFPCQRLFNNITKRSMIPSLNNKYNINPTFLSDCN